MGPLSLAILLAAGAGAVDHEADRKALQGIVDRLLAATRDIKEVSTLPQAKKLDLPPPFEGEIHFSYSKQVSVTLDCPSGTKPGCSIAAARICGSGDDRTGLIGAGTDLHRFTVIDGKPSPDRAALILAHEIGHIRLDHSGQGRIKYEELYDKWFVNRGFDMEQRFRKEEESRFKTIGSDEIKMIERAVQERLSKAFEKQTAEAYAEWSRQKEAEADDYGWRLAVAAGYSPEKAAGLFLEYEAGVLLSPFTDPPECPARLAKPDYAAKSIHPSNEDRDRLFFEKFYLRGK